MRSSSIFGASAFIGIGLLAAANAQAVPVNYGDFIGTTVKFTSVTEDSATDPVPLFGAPTISGDALDFNPTNFVSSSSGGAFDSTIAVLNFTIEALPGNYVEEIKFYEAGDYTIFGAGGIGTSATVSAPVFINVVEIDGVAVAPINFNANMVFTPSNGDYNLADDGAGFGVIWTGILDVDVDALLTGANVPFVNGATEVKVILNNILATTSENGSSAEIQKKDVQGFGITVVPEPASALLLAALGLPLATRRKR